MKCVGGGEPREPACRHQKRGVAHRSMGTGMKRGEGRAVEREGGRGIQGKGKERREHVEHYDKEWNKKRIKG